MELHIQGSQSWESWGMDFIFSNLVRVVLCYSNKFCVRPGGRWVEVSGKTRTMSPAKQARSVGDLLRFRAGETPGQLAHRAKVNGTWQETDWQTWYEQSLQTAHQLQKLGVEKGDKVAILGPTGTHWAIYDMGGQLAGAVTLGVYPKQAPEQIAYILNHSGARVLFVDASEDMEQVLEATNQTPELKAIVPWDSAHYQAHKNHPRIVSPQAFMGSAMGEAQVFEISERTSPDDTAILIYTSGTTGPPKGAMITHGNILAMVDILQNSSRFYPDDLCFGFLPMAHVTQRVMAFYSCINQGTPTAYATNMGSVLTEVQEAKPTIFGSVPRIYEKAYNKIHTEVAKKPGVVQAIFRMACGVGKKRAGYLIENKPLPIILSLKCALADALVFKKIRAAFGGRVRMFITGAAPITEDILLFFWGAGMPVFEGYGMTEATVITHLNLFDAVRPGTVGKPLPGIQVKIAEDGEILFRGATVFKGYYKNPEATNETIRNGWLHSGDIGVEDEDGFLRITDRKKHIIITAGGKNVAPANIERAVKSQSPLISHVHAHGDRRNYISAIIAPSPIETLEWGVARGLVESSQFEILRDVLLANPAARTDALNNAMAAVVAHPEFALEFVEPVRQGNRRLAQVERIRKFVVLPRDFSQEIGEMTPTMKLKRKTVEGANAQLFDRIYSDPSFAVDVELGQHAPLN